MSLLKLFDFRQWEPLDLEGFIEDGKLTDKGVVYACVVLTGIAVAFGV
jgi:hypothetical protein